MEENQSVILWTTTTNTENKNTKRKRRESSTKGDSKEDSDQ